MTKKTLLSSLLSLVLVLGLASAAFAVPYWGHADDTTTWDSTHTFNYTYDSTYALKYLSGATYTQPAVPAGVPTGSLSTYVHGTFNVTLQGTWTATDTLTATLYKDGVATSSTVTALGVNSLGENYVSLYYDLYATYTAGSSYYVVAQSLTDSASKTWKLTSSSFSFDGGDYTGVTGNTATPLPAAVWILGSGLLGVMGFKRSRKNAA